MERCVVDCDCLEERRAVVCRLVEITAVLLELNNFSGVLEVTAALNGAAVHRLSASFEVFSTISLNLQSDRSCSCALTLLNVETVCVGF